MEVADGCKHLAVSVSRSRLTKVLTQTAATKLANAGAAPTPPSRHVHRLRQLPAPATSVSLPPLTPTAAAAAVRACAPPSPPSLHLHRLRQPPRTAWRQVDGGYWLRWLNSREVTEVSTDLTDLTEVTNGPDKADRIVVEADGGVHALAAAVAAVCVSGGRLTEEAGGGC